MKYPAEATAVEIEDALIGELTTDCAEFGKVQEMLREQDFYSEFDRKMFGFMKVEYAIKKQFDLITLVDRMKLNGMEKSISELVDRTTLTTSPQPLYHAQIIVDKSVLRSLNTLYKEQANGFDWTVDPSESMDAMRQGLDSIYRRYDLSETQPIKDVALSLGKHLEKIRKGEKFSIPFYFREIDRMTGGMQGGQLIVVSGMEKSGKSTLTLQMGFKNAEHGVPVAIFSGEMKAIEYVQRYVEIKSRTSHVALVSNKLHDEQWHGLYDAIDGAANLGIFLNDRVTSLSLLEAESESLVARYKVGLIIVDYIQIIPVTSERGKSREQEVASISRGLKRLAMKLNVPVIALSQLNEDYRARESRAIEQDMDKLVSIKRGDIPQGVNFIEVDIMIRQRMGASGNYGDVKLHYDLFTGSFADIETHVSEPPPSFNEPKDTLPF